MTLKEFAKKIDRRDVWNTGYNPLTKEEKDIAKREGIVVVYGYSDDNMEFDGAIYEEIGCFDGGIVYITKDGKFVSKEKTQEDFFYIRAKWCEERREIDGLAWESIPWTYETDIPHEEFFIYDNGDPWCVGIVFRLDQLKNYCVPPASDEIIFAKVKENAILPQKEDENAGYDIYPCFDEDYMIIPPHSTEMIPTGIACALNPKWYFQVEEQGSTGSRGIKKSAGVINAGYRGEIFVSVSNINSKRIVVSKLSKEEVIKRMEEDHHDNWHKNHGCIYYPYEKAIAQLVLHEVPKMRITEISYEDLLKIPSCRGEGKLGSSGK